MRTICSRLLLAAALGASIACAPMRGPAEPGFDPDSEPITLRIENRHWLDVNVYLVRSGQRIRRLGTVTSHSVAIFRAPARQIVHVSDVYLVADPIGSHGTFRSEPLLVSRGQQVEWLLSQTLHRSALSIW